MAYDATDLEQVASVLEQAAGPITEATCILFDFDGPICGLFAEHRAHDIADRLIAWLADERGLEVPLEGRERQDPHAVLRTVGEARHPDHALTAELEQILTDEELSATRTARPTPYVDDLIRAWSARGAKLAIATNNSPAVAARYLADHGLDRCFADHIYGRTSDVRLLKPHPDCLDRALRGLGARPAQTLMIGDTTSDLLAARRAGVAFLGYAQNERRVRRLLLAGADTVVDSLEKVLDLVTGPGRQA
ncbi:HAD family hydrolase [Streptomyces sp. NPDC051561]|uniref:HAD family hydrolase n=1 Tax=Streptomyces sp. NPDC051561 TaxID=3365658 RepID=UPI003792DDE2